MAKKRKKMGNRKDRIVEVRVDFGKEVTIGGMSAPGVEPLQFFDLNGNSVIPKHIEIGAGYARKKPGLKVLQRAAADRRNILRDPTRALQRFKTLIAVDTNTISLDGVQVAYSDDGDRRFRFIVTGLERGEVLDVNDNSVGHDGLGVGASFGCLSRSS